MNNNRYYKNIACLSIVAGIVTYTTQAQESANSPAAFERMKTENLWSRSSNAGGILLDNPIQYSIFDVSYHSYGGKFHRPQQGQEGNELYFSAEGGIALKKLYVWGNFEYRKENIREANFNSSIIDPYRGMPYYTADLNASNWNNQFYNMQFKAALSLSNSISVGLDGIYKVAQAAKQRDPRTLNHFYSLELKPGIVFSPATAHRIGLNLEYCNLKENSSPSLVNVSDYQTYYELYGLGTAIENIGTGKVVNYVGDKVGGNLQYNYRKPAINLLLSGGYSFRVEQAEFSFTTPEKFGTAREKEWNIRALLGLSGNIFSHHLQAVYTHAGIDGIQYVKRNTTNQGWQVLHRYVRSTYQTETASIDYTLTANRGKEYKWKTGAGVRYLKKNDAYLLPYSVKDAENLLFSVNGKALAFCSDKLSRRLLLGLEAGYNQNLSGIYSYTGNYAGYDMVTVLEHNDLNYLVSDFYFLEGNITYSQKIREEDKANVYVKGSFSYRKTNDFEFNHRSLLQISIGCNY
ncbi:MAG: hypothetical protein LBG18_08245 [Mediterranea sp.]|jgi:hypothetical protein|nr:hypothetical protein [Mediterranea sp.]